MALFGPRLDRPSALGDEGRPRATSLTIASLLVFGLFVVATTCPWNYGLRFGDGLVPSLIVPTCARLGRLTLAFGTVTGLLTAGLALLTRERFVSLFVGQICFLPAGAALVAGLTGLLVTSPAYGIFFGGFAVALVALGSTWTDTTSASAVRPALFQEGLTYLSMVGWGIVVVVLGGAALLVRTVVGPAGSGPGPTAALSTFLVVVFVGVLSFRLGLRWLPIRQLTPRNRREAVDRRLGQLRLATTVVLIGTLVAVLCVLPAWFLGWFDAVYALFPPARVLFPVLATPIPVVAVLGVGVVTLALGLVALTLRRLTRPVDTTANRLLAPVAAGLVLVIGFLPFALSLIPVPGSAPPIVLVAFLVLGPIALYLLGWTVVAAQYLSLVPERAGGPALAAGGMVFATIGAALTGVPTPLVVATAVVAMVVWDVSSFGLGVTAELGHLPETRRLELFHAVVAVVLGAATVLSLSLLGVVRTSLAGEVAATVAAALAVFGVLVLLTPLRGYVAGEGRD
ncbi:glycosyl transferase [Halomicrobium sp. HM KBTZ05]|uniref:DUF7519 family protein n=1 Tax=Halomicrobium sp. HM KBTZ05 TaxID=3242663 RepID=UPI003557D501